MISKWFVGMYNHLAGMTPAEIAWVVVGFIAQLTFSARFIVQWIASEKAKRSVMPVAFWYISLAGGLMLLSYAIHKQDIVFIFGQFMGVFVYVRNLILIYKQKPVEAKA